MKRLRGKSSCYLHRSSLFIQLRGVLRHNQINGKSNHRDIRNNSSDIPEEIQTNRKELLMVDN
jgi:hypothetical protein